jgi:hypothetical protein
MAITEDKHNRYKDEYDKSYKSADYSMKRMDIILVSVSMAGIFFYFYQEFYR